jgi:tRNA (adenine22-N1)-methyltransferase
MGGETICRILERGMMVARGVERLILQPQNHPERVRTWLLEHGFGLIAEDLVEERGHFYPVIVAAAGSWESDTGCLPPEIGWHWGLRLGFKLVAEHHPVLLKQVERLLSERKAVLAGLTQAGGQRSRNARERLAREVAELELISKWLYRSLR